MAKKRKLRQTRGISIFLASQTGFPWSWDSTSANWSRFCSTRSAILRRRLERIRGDVWDQLKDGGKGGGKERGKERGRGEGGIKGRKEGREGQRDGGKE